jgi:predicted secreted hydrolase
LVTVLRLSKAKSSRPSVFPYTPGPVILNRSGSPRPVPRFWISIAALAVIALAGLACGGSPSAETAATAPPATATPVPVQPSPTPVPSPTPTATPDPLPAEPVVPAKVSAPPHDGPVSLPRDEGRHDDQIEWWYFNGHLADDTGNRFSYHYVAFEFVSSQGIIPRVLQYSFLDHRTGQRQTGEQFYVANAPAPGTMPDETGAAPPLSTGGGAIALRTGDLVMAGDGDEYRLVFQPGGVQLDLTAVSRKPAILHQETGVVDLGPAGVTRYYTRPRLETAGTLTVDGEVRQVNGLSWMDHQWGDATTALDVGWDWLSLQLDDGTDLMVSVVWDAGSGEPIGKYGTLSPPAGDDAGADGTVYLTGDQITLTPTSSWTSPASGGEYPMGWRLSIDLLDNPPGNLPGDPVGHSGAAFQGELALTLEPVVENAEFPPSPFVPVDYWEGAVAVSGTRDGQLISGQGFVEMVGYAPLRALTPPQAPP